MVTSHTTARQRRVYDRARACPQRHMRDAAAFRKEEQIAGLEALAIRRYRNLSTLPELLIAVARERNAARPVHRLHEAGAIDAPLGAPAPEIRRSGEPSLCQLRKREVTGLHT